MKTRYVFIAIALSACLASCQKDLPEPAKQTGSLHIEIGLFIRVNEISSMLKSTLQTEHFRVCIYRSDGAEIMAFDRASEMPEDIELETGGYYVAAYSGNNLAAAFENPYYYGESEVFTISGNQHQSVLVNCMLANTMVTIVYSARVRDNFTDYTTTVTSELGSLAFIKDETRSGYFQPLPLLITAVLTYQKPDGSPAGKTLSGNIPAPLANRHYEIHVDASLDEGTASFQILLDDTPIGTEIVEITDDEGIQQTGRITQGELLITEIMFDPLSLADTEGEWFEIYNNSDHAISLQNIVIERDDVNLHIVSEAIELPPASYFVFERTVQATEANGYIYGSGISLTNTGAVLSLSNEGTEGSPGTLICSVDYGGENFPGDPGGSISLDPGLINPADAVLGTSWCVSASVYSTGDRGTPGLANDACSQ